MNIDWRKVRWFVHRRTMYCTVAVTESDGIRLFPIGSLRIGDDGRAKYFEVFARPVQEGADITFLAVDVNPLFWILSLLKGRFSHPPALRMRGTAGPRRPATEEEEQHWFRRVGLALKTRGGQILWSRPGKIREVEIREVRGIRLASTTRHLNEWLQLTTDGSNTCSSGPTP